MANDFERLAQQGDKIIGSATHGEQSGQPGSQVSRLKRQVGQLRQENQRLKQRSNQPQINLQVTPRGLSTSETIRQNGQTYNSSPTHLNVFDEDLEGLSQILTDLVQVARSSARGAKIMLRQPERTRGTDGKTVQATDADNRKLFHPNRLDRVLTQAQLLWDNPETRDALLSISHYIETREFQEKVEKATLPVRKQVVLPPASPQESSEITDDSPDF
jgi:hypothetical protein